MAGICSAMVLTLVLASGCIVEPRGRVEYRAGVVVTAPAPAVVVVPDDYYWDGFEYVGFVGGAYFYLGPGNVWMRCEPWRVERFEGWERGHSNWREHAVHNDRYRGNGRGRDRGHGDDR